MHEPARVLVVDDETGLRKFLQRELTTRGMHVEMAASAEEGLDKIRRGDFEVVLLDVRMPGMSGLEALREIRRIGGAPQVLILTGQGSVDSAVEAMRSGAFHYLTKPFHLDALEVEIGKAREQSRLQSRARAFERLLSGAGAELIGESAVLEEVRTLIGKVAPADTSVLIEGDSGTGKELIARAIHAASRRADRAFVVVNCGALQETLLESELFGHEEGAFTGAVKTREGLAEAADGGTLFLDEVGELGMPMQSKLLRFLESGEIRRVGSNRVRRMDVRVIAATNRQLSEAVAEGGFREDLYYRLRVFSILAPPLRDRLEDVPLLIGHFLQAIRGAGRGPFEVDPDVLEAARRYPWPGNVRELRNAVERMMILADDGRISASCLPSEVAGRSSDVALDELDLATVERHLILRALRECGGKKTEAAARLGISVRTLYNKINAYAEQE